MSLFGTVTRLPAVKLGIIAGLILVMQIPVFMVSGLVDERQGRQSDVLREFERGWGPAQTVYGPVLAIPYRTPSPPKRGEPVTWTRGWVQVTPDRTEVKARLQPETRRRGMFEATVYTADIALSGTLKVPPVTLPPAREAELLWGEARLILGVTAARGMAADAAVTVAGQDRPLEPASGAPGCGTQYLGVPMGFSGQPAADPIPFATRFALHGTRAFQLAPEARAGTVAMQAAWPNPSFLEGMMPTRYAIDAKGFDATWDVAGPPGSAGAVDLGEAMPGCRESSAGVALIEAVPTYLMVQRTVKYETLFLVLAFLTYFLFESLSGIRIHAMQYALLGLSLVLFPLILVAVAEPAGFTLGYAAATAAVLAQATLYTLSVTASRALAARFAAVLAMLFAYLYVVLSLESYALLAGTTALFAVLSVVMAATRRINWTAASA